MLSVLSRLSLKQKFILFATLPMLMVVIFGSVRIYSLSHQYDAAKSNALTTQVTLKIEQLIFDLQQERGLSAGYLGSQGKMFGPELEAQRLKTDEKINDLLNNSSLKKAIDTTKNELSLFDSLKESIGKASTERNNLLLVRQQVSALDASDFFSIYSDFNQKLINFDSRLRFRNKDSYLVRAQRDLINLLKIQELTGQENGLINQLLSAPIISLEVFKSIQAIDHKLNDAILHTQSVVTLENRHALETLLSSPEQLAILKVREQIKSQINLVNQTHKIRDIMGYGGLTHDYYNYLKSRESQYLESFNRNYFALQSILGMLNNEPTLTPKQHEWLNVIERTIIDYQANILLFQKLTEHNRPLGTPKGKMLVVDQPMLEALQQLQYQSPQFPSQSWWRLAGDRLSRLHNISSQLTDKIAKQSEAEKNQALNSLWFSLIYGLIIFYLIFLLGRHIADNLIDSIKAIVNDMQSMAKDPNLEIQVAVKGNDEIAQLSVSLNQMLNERQKAKRELSQASAVFKYSSEGIIVTDANNRIELINPAFTKITGYTLEDVKGQNPSILSSEHHQKEFYQALWRTLKEEDRWEGEIWNKRKDGQVYPEYLAITAVRNERSETLQYIGLFLDISNNKQYEQDIWYKTNYDSLTKLPNRHLFSNRLQQNIEQAGQDSAQVVILFIDLDRFKYINELHGHAAGNEVLKQSATRLESVIGKNDSIARIGGDEFVIIAPQHEAAHTVEQLAHKISEVLSRPFKLDNKETNISSSFGIAFYPEDGQDIETLLRNAETAMYQAKSDGRAHFQYFSPEMNVDMLARIQLEQRLRKAVTQSEFYLQYQPIIDMDLGTISSVEALIRWRDPEQGMISPDKFIPIAEETGLIEPLGEWILHQALTDLAHWHAKGYMIKMAINVSGRQCINSKGLSFYQILKDALVQHAIEAKYLHIEITETMLIEDTAHCLQTLESIKQMGVDIYLDDFGTGYSALSYLKRFPISVIKIDKSFIDNALESQADANLVKAIVMMGQSLEMPLVAEGIETSAQWTFLHDLGCDYAQGYWMSRPLNRDDLTHFLQQKKMMISQEQVSDLTLAC